jgi:hypothetical protein
MQNREFARKSGVFFGFSGQGRPCRDYPGRAQGVRSLSLSTCSKSFSRTLEGVQGVQGVPRTSPIHLYLHVGYIPTLSSLKFQRTPCTPCAPSKIQILKLERRSSAEKRYLQPPAGASGRASTFGVFEHQTELEQNPSSDARRSILSTVQPRTLATSPQGFGCVRVAPTASAAAYRQKRDENKSALFGCTFFRWVYLESR